MELTPGPPETQSSSGIPLFILCMQDRSSHKYCLKFCPQSAFVIKAKNPT